MQKKSYAELLMEIDELREELENTKKRLKESLKVAHSSDMLKVAFMKNISHEIRTPLNSIIGFAELIIDPSLSESEKNNFLQILNISSKRLMQTVTDYLDLSLISTGNMEVSKKSFTLIQLVDELHKPFELQCRKNDLSFSFVVPPNSSSIQIFTDKVLVKKILMHLFDNAVKFTKAGYIIISISVKDKYLEFFIKDSGIGISKNSLPLIFDYFTQEDPSSTRMYEGSGIGLSIVHGLVILLGGSLRVESTKSLGSTFSFTIPLETSYPTNDTTQNRVSMANT